MDFDPIKTLLAQAIGITVVQDTGALAPLAAVPDGVTLESLEQFQAAPNHIDGNTALHRYNDFTRYVNSFKLAGSRIFVQPDLTFTRGGTLAKVYFDFPEPGKPSWSNHTAELVVTPSLEYKLLTSLAGKGLLPQAEFALALRDISRFCTSLSSADLVEIAQTLTLSSKGEFASIEDNFSGSVRFGYDVQVKATSDATARKNIEVPQSISFNLPVLLGGQPVDISAELIYRIPASKEDKVKLGIRLPDQQFVERAVLEDLVNSLEADTSVPVALGHSDVAA